MLLPKQEAKVRLIDLEYTKVEGAYPFVDGHYIRGYSFELNAHNITLLEQIKNAKSRSEALRRCPGSFVETLVAMQKDRKLSNKQLADSFGIAHRPTAAATFVIWREKELYYIP